MINILLVDNRPDFIKRMKLKLLSHLEVTAIAKDNIVEASEVVDFIPGIQLVVGLESFNEESKTIPMLRVYLESKDQNIPAYLYQLADEDTEVMTAIAERLGLEFDPKKVSVDEFYNYHPIPIRNIQDLNSPCDLYIRVGSESDNQQFVKRVSAFDTVDDQLFAKLLSFSVDNVYIQKDDYDIFFTSLANSYSEKLLIDDLNQRLKRQYEAYQYIVQYSNKLKFEIPLRELAENVITSVCDTIMVQKSLAELINKVVGHKDSIHFQTFYLTNLICSFLLKRDGHLSSEALTDIVFASLFCDLSLEERNSFFINSQEELELAVEERKLTQKEAREVQIHALENSQILEDYPGIRAEVIQIVRQHHGSDQGKDFHDVPDSKVSPVSKLFITGNTFIKYFLNPRYKFNKKEILEKMTLRFANDPLLKKYTHYLTQKID